MPKPKRRPQRRTASHRRPSAARRRAEPDLMQDVVAILERGTPLDLLGLVSALMGALDQRPHPFQDGPPADLPSTDVVVEALLHDDSIESSALLTAFATLTSDTVLAERIVERLTDRDHALPDWLTALADATPTGQAAEMSHVLGDGDNVMFGVRLPGGPELTAVVYIDHNLGTLVKDAFVVDEPLPQLARQLVATVDDPDMTITDIPPADARTRFGQAAATAAMTWPRLETDTWPACRPLTEWMARLLPEGGTGYQRPQWDCAATDRLAGRVLASTFAAGLDDPDHRDLLDSLLWFGRDYGPGDPMRWSPSAVEIVLTDWIPRKIVADLTYLAKAPDVLRALIRFCHHERGIRPTLTEETLAAVDAFEPEYQDTIRHPRPQGIAALIAASGLAATDRDP